MKRRVIQRRVVVFLLLLLAGGAIVNVAVAWGCMLLFPPIFFNPGGFVGASELSLQDGVRLLTNYLPDSPAQVDSVYATTHGRFGWKYLSASGKAANERGSVWVRQKCAGWPLLSLSGIEKLGSPPKEGQRRTCGIFEVPTILLQERYWRLIEFLPFMPTWPGFAINSIFYAAILWVVFFVPGKVKRTRRRRRGQCPACAYPVGVSPVCTECGGPTANVKTSGPPLDNSNRQSGETKI